MTIDEARVWLQHHADNTPMPGAREAYKAILDELKGTRWIPVEERLPENNHKKAVQATYFVTCLHVMDVFKTGYT